MLSVICTNPLFQTWPLLPLEYQYFHHHPHPYSLSYQYLFLTLYPNLSPCCTLTHLYIWLNLLIPVVLQPTFFPWSKVYLGNCMQSFDFSPIQIHFIPQQKIFLYPEINECLIINNFKCTYTLGLTVIIAQGSRDLILSSCHCTCCFRVVGVLLDGEGVLNSNSRFSVGLVDFERLHFLAIVICHHFLELLVCSCRLHR